MRSKTRRLALGAACLLAAGFVLVRDSIVIVKPGELAVVRRFGRVLPGSWTPGPHLAWPLGIDRIVKVRLDQVRQIAVGSADPAMGARDPGAGERLSGDRNLVRVEGVLQYHVADPTAFVIAGSSVEPALEAIVRASLADAVSHRSIDAILGGERVAVAREVERSVEDKTGTYRLGVAVNGFNLASARPPDEVREAFDLAQAERNRRETRTEEALAESAAAAAQARAEARGRVDRSSAAADRRVTLARAEAERFAKLLDASRTGRAQAVRRLWFDSLNTLLPRVKRKLILSGDEPIDLGIFSDESK